MAIPNPAYARYNSFQEFLARTKGRDNSPSFTNLYSVRFMSPSMMRTYTPANFLGPVQTEKFDIGILNKCTG